MILDIVSFGKGNMVANADGEYTPSLIRWDVFNGALPDDQLFDVEYIALENDLNKIIDLNSDLETVTLISGGQFSVYDTATKEVISNENPSDSVIKEPPKAEETNTDIKLSLSLSDIKSKVARETGSFQKVEIVDDEYVTAYAVSGRRESYAQLYLNGAKVSGQYMIFKYRYTADRKTMGVYTKAETSTGYNYFTIPVVNDDEWHIIIVDMSNGGNAEQFAANTDGKYVLSYFRLDLFDDAGEDKLTTGEERIDIATIAFTDDLSKAIANDKSVAIASVYDIATNTTVNYDTSDGSIIAD
jgi:hypothetical protein